MPKKGIAPDFTGVAGVLVDAAPEGIVFGERKFATSPYDPLIIQLRDAGAGKFLKFSDLKARVSLKARAKKLNVNLLFGEEGSTLWVTLAKANLLTDGKTEDQPSRSLADTILLAIDAKRHKPGEITTWCRSNGAAGVGLTQVEGVIRNLAREGKIKLKAAIKGDDDPEMWVRR